MIFALVGNQNSGKTTLFNQLTGSNQRVGNFPGVTVDQKFGEIRFAKDCSVVDLPGIYSIRTYSNEEIITRDFILHSKPDGIINIVDATNIERHLYLTLQLIEMRIPMVLALNMMDEVRANGGTIDIDEMSRELGITVVPISAAKNEGIDELISKMTSDARNQRHPERIDFCEPGPVHRCIHAISYIVEDHAEKLGVPSRFAAIKAIEGDADIISQLALSQNELEMIEHSIIQMETEQGMDRDAALADMRYNFIEKLCANTVVRPGESREFLRSVRIDSVLTNKYLALPLFLGIMLTIFWLTFNLIGAYLSDWFALGITELTELVDTGLTALDINPVVKSLVVDGAFAGVGSVLGFLPIIITLFFFLSILEDTGYMARIAFVMDKLMRKIGLSGRSIVPMLIGFGCTVPALMATRTLSSERDRIMTIMLTPFMSCSAKIPIYALFTAAFFVNYQALVMVILYLTGILAAILVALLSNRTFMRGKPVPFVMELPNYRFPSLRNVLLLMWEKAWDFLRRAFTIIFVASIIIWFLQTFDLRLNLVSDSSESLLAVIGQWIAPVFKPLGLADWRVSTALITGLTAKEAVVSTLGVLTHSTAAELPSVLNSMFTPLTAVSFLAFTLLYTPCVAAIATIKRELGSGLKTAGLVAAQCGIAWAAAFIIYNLSRLILY